MAIEFPEALKISGQMKDVLVGRKISKIEIRDINSSVFRWGFVNLQDVDLTGRVINSISHHGDDIFIHMDGMNLRFGAMIGKLLYHKIGESIPKKAQVTFNLDDGCSFTYNPSLYGWAQGLTDEQMEKCIKAGGLSPLDSLFTYEYLSKAFAEPKRKIVKQMNVDFVEYKAAGVGNGYWHDILFLSGVHPERKTSDVTMDEVERLWSNIIKVIKQAVDAGGSVDEVDLFGHPGGYKRILGKHSKDMTCPVCGTKIETKNVLGSASYYCPACQR